MYDRMSDGGGWDDLYATLWIITGMVVVFRFLFNFKVLCRPRFSKPIHKNSDMKTFSFLCYLKR